MQLEKRQMGSMVVVWMLCHKLGNDIIYREVDSIQKR